MKKIIPTIPIIGMFFVDYPIKRFFWLFFVYQVSLLGFTTYLLSHYLFYGYCL